LAEDEEEDDSEQGTRSEKVDDEVLALRLKLLGESLKESR
jgi:hypothetical protein